MGTLETLTIVGGGHVALALSRVMAALPLRIVVLDDRPELSTMLENKWAHSTRVISYDDVVQHVPDGDLSYVVIMTHEHANDEAVLGRLATRSYRYLGMMGSPAKVRQLFSNLVAAGLPAESLEQVHSPIGIPIHNHTPEEIAISIADESTAELMRHFYSNLEAGLPKDEALRAAQLAFIRGQREADGSRAARDLSDLFNWAAFQLYGDWR